MQVRPMFGRLALAKGYYLHPSHTLQMTLGCDTIRPQCPRDHKRKNLLQISPTI